MSIEKEQRDILFEACRQIATNKRTPPWIQGYLTQAVIKAKSVAENGGAFPESLDGGTKNEVKETPAAEPLAVGDDVSTKMFDKTTYLAKIVRDDGICDGVQLFSIGELRGNGPRGEIAGYVIPNVPAHWLKKE